MKLSSLRSPILQHTTLIFARILIDWQLTTERLGLPDDQTQLSVAHIDHRVVAGIKHAFKPPFHMFSIYLGLRKSSQFYQKKLPEYDCFASISRT